MSEAPLTVTIKNGGKHEETWAVFKGTIYNIRQDLVEYYGLTVDEDQTLFEVAHMAQEVAQNFTGFGKALGARVITKSESVTEQAPTVAEPAENPHADLIARLLAAESAEALKTLWAKNKAAFDDAEVKAAYSKRGKELKKSG